MPLKLFRRPGSPHWYIRGTVRGHSAYETTGTDEKAAAEAIRIKREAELLNRSVFGPGASTKFEEAAASYLAAGGEARYLGAYDEKAGKWTLLIGQFLGTPIGDIGQAEADTAVYALYPRAKASTRRRQGYGPIAAVLHHAADKGWIRAPRLKLPKVKQPETRYSTVDRMNRLLPKCSAPLRRLVVFLAYTGARISECLRVDWERDINLSMRTVTLRRTKNGKPRTVHLADALLLELAEVSEAKRTGRLFPNWASRYAVYKPLRRAAEKAGVDYLPTHQQGRHTFAAGLRIHAKRDLRGLMEDGGWDSIQSVMRYMHLTPGESVDAINRLPSVQNTCSQGKPEPKQLKKKAKSR